MTTKLNRLSNMSGHLGVFLLGAAIIRVAFAEPPPVSWAEAGAVASLSPVFMVASCGIAFIIFAIGWGK